jgi:hypothetical protein
LLDESWSPCRRSHPAGGTPPRQPACDGSCGLRVFTNAQPPGHFSFRATCAFTPVAARTLADPPCEGVVDGLQNVGYPSSCHPSYGAAGSCPSGTVSAEHISVTLDARELLKLGLDVAERTAPRLMPRRRPRPSQTWRTFLANHVRNLVSLISSQFPPRVHVLWGPNEDRWRRIAARLSRLLIQAGLLPRAATQARGIGALEFKTAGARDFKSGQTAVKLRPKLLSQNVVPFTV